MRVALAVLAALATVAPEPAAAQTVTFISNTGQASFMFSTLVRATAFTTGTGTYTLSGVGILYGQQTGPLTAVVEIYGDTGGNPGALVATMTTPIATPTETVVIFSAPANTTLSASTTYWLVTRNSATTNGRLFRIGVIHHATLDSGTAAGWSLGNFRYKNDIHDTSWSAHHSPHRFQIRGTVLTTPNTPATGAPAISGTPQVGQTLTAATTAIMDANGLTSVSYAYQWIRVAIDSTETNIARATASTYTLVAADRGNTIKVKVSFTDDDGNAETRTSAATAAIAPPPAAASTAAGDRHDRDHLESGAGRDLRGGRDDRGDGDV